MAEITGAEIGANYKKFVGGIALGRAQTRARRAQGFLRVSRSTPSTKR